jgi:hypothetical protein
MPMINQSGLIDNTLIGTVPSYTPTPTDCAKLNEKESTPRLMSIQSIGIENACLEAIGVADDGTLGAPKEYMSVGYLLNSSNYVKPGVAVYTCHHSFLSDIIALCDDLEELADDGTIIVELNSGQRKTYQVKEVKTVHVTEVDMKEFVTAIEVGKESLSVMTCVGYYDNQIDDISHRLLIRAVLIN